jgi:hypothetical protein
MHPGQILAVGVRRLGATMKDQDRDRTVSYSYFVQASEAIFLGETRSENNEIRRKLHDFMNPRFGFGSKNTQTDPPQLIGEIC